MSRLIAHIRSIPPWIRIYCGRTIPFAIIFTGPPTPRKLAASMDWEPLRQLQEWSVS